MSIVTRIGMIRECSLPPEEVDAAFDHWLEVFLAAIRLYREKTNHDIGTGSLPDGASSVMRLRVLADWLESKAKEYSKHAIHCRPLEYVLDFPNRADC